MTMDEIDRECVRLWDELYWDTNMSPESRIEKIKKYRKELVGMSESRIYKVAHYNQGDIETIEVIRDWDLNFCLGNAVKYIARAKHKGAYIEDLKKAMRYIEMEIEHSERIERRESIESPNYTGYIDG